MRRIRKAIRRNRCEPAIITKIIFPVADMAESKKFYTTLGFEVENYDQGYAWVKKNGREIFHLALRADLDPNTNHCAGYFHIQDVTAWHKAWAETDKSEIEDKPWRMREFSLKDPNGNLLRFGQHL